MKNKIGFLRKYLFSIISIITTTILIIMFFICVTFEQREYDYELEISPNQNGNYSLTVPYPTIKPEVSIVNGTIGAKEIQTIYGNMLKITSMNKVNVSYKFSKWYFNPFITRYNNNSLHGYWNGIIRFYLEGISNVSIRFFFIEKYRTSNIAGYENNVTLKTNFTQGWNEFKLKGNIEHWDGVCLVYCVGSILLSGIVTVVSINIQILSRKKK